MAKFGGWVANIRGMSVLNCKWDGWLSLKGWVAKLVACPLAAAALRVRIQTSPKNVNDI